MRLGELPSGELRRRLHGHGLRLRTGPLVFRIRSVVPEVERGLAALYADYPADDQAFADFDVSVQPVGGLRRWWRPQLHFGIDGQQPFSPLPGDQGLPMLEWGMNWCATGHAHDHLILHSAVVERGGRAMLLPAPSGSGKSTLCAALVLSGWRLLSDELALIEMDRGRLVPMPRPVSLKNASIEVIRGFTGGRVRYGSLVRDTIKGVVAHFAAPPEAVARSAETVPAGWVLFPRYQAGAPTRMTLLPRAQALVRLMQNAFNHNVHRRAGFERLADLVEGSTCVEFSYSRLDEALAAIDRLAEGRPDLAAD